MAGGMLMSGAIAALLTTALPAHPSSPVVTDPPPDKIVIDVATVNGSGCPQGTAAVAVSPDNTAFTVTYSDYLAQVGGNSDPTAFRKNCQLNLIVHVPQGFTYAIASADYRGFLSLQPGASGTQRASYYFQAPRTPPSRTTRSTAPTTTTGRPPTAPTGPNWCGRPAGCCATSTSTPNCASARAAARPARSAS